MRQVTSVKKADCPLPMFNQNNLYEKAYAYSLNIIRTIIKTNSNMY
jgi:hypothetical protein